MTPTPSPSIARRTARCAGARAFGVAILAMALSTACTPADGDSTADPAPTTARTPAEAPAAANPADASPIANPAGASPGTGAGTGAPVDGPSPSTPASPSTTVGGDGSEIQLDALTPGDVSGADLAGELACGFTGGDGAPLLQAMGIVASREAAQGVVKVSGYVERVNAPGGFDGMTGDPVFTGKGKTLRIVQTGAAIGGGESPPRPATLTYQRADGASRTFDGVWQCGP